MSRLAPFNLAAWIDENRHLLKPPVGNKAIWNDGQFLVMVVGGPNDRSDYHVNPGEELFYQIEGDIVLRIIEDGSRGTSRSSRATSSCSRPAYRIRRSGLRTPSAWWSNTRDARRRSTTSAGIAKNAAAWCMMYEFRPADIGAQIKAALAEFNGSEALRTCKACGEELQGFSRTMNTDASRINCKWAFDPSACACVICR